MATSSLSAGPVLFFGGPYSNLEAFEAVLREAARRAIPSERIVCTGDLVAYGADASACVTLARELRIQVVMGNCEEQLAAGEPDRGCGYAPGSTCDLLSRTWYAHALQSLDMDARRWLGGRPRQLDIEVGRFRLAVVHGSLNSINRFVFASTPSRIKALDLEASGADGIVAGHCGLPFTQSIGGKLWHNPGTAGLPANDGTPLIWCSVILATDDELIIEHVALAYDHATAATKMRAAGLTEAYALALDTGLWPSCETLPPGEAKAAGKKLSPTTLRFGARTGEPLAWPVSSEPTQLAAEKFRDATWTAKGEQRASVALTKLETLWLNTGTLCNLSCANCYIESTPRNDRLAYLSAEEAAAYFDEIKSERLGTQQIGFTGGEPFMNPDFPAMLADALERGFEVLVLTNAMKPMEHHLDTLLRLRERHGNRLVLRVSIDHYTRELHELERGPRSWEPAIAGLQWLARNGFNINVAGRLYSGEAEAIVRSGYAGLFKGLDIPVDAHDLIQLTLFPEMDESVDVPEITEACWGILGKSPEAMMCSNSRMVVKRKGANKPSVLACTLLAYDERFELGTTLAEAAGPVALNHPHCAKFCVLGGAACSR